jgi:hypothetical protein
MSGEKPVTDERRATTPTLPPKGRTMPDPRDTSTSSEAGRGVGQLAGGGGSDRELRPSSPTSLPLPCMDLLIAGMRSAWLPEGYSVVAIHVDDGPLVLGVGTLTELVATERLALSVHLSDRHPPRECGPLWEGVALAWARLCVAAWAHHRDAIAATTTEGEG